MIGLDEEDIYSDAYSEGRIAYLAGIPLTENPYGPRDRRFDQWSGGWRCELDIQLESHPLDLED